MTLSGPRAPAAPAAPLAAPADAMACDSAVTWAWRLLKPELWAFEAAVW